MSGASNLHGTAVALGRTAVLFRGVSGSGKSDLALRCLMLAPGPLLPEPLRLVADDQVLVEAAGGLLRARSPAPLRGLIEVRGLGIVKVPWTEDADIGLVVDLIDQKPVQRLPEPRWTDIHGVNVRALALWPFEPSAAAKVVLALQGNVTDGATAGR